MAASTSLKLLPSTGGDANTDFYRSITDYLATQGSQASGVGQGTFSSGVSALQQPLAYYEKILSGNQAEMESAVAPETTSILDRYRGARKNIANLSPRSGGANEANVKSQYQQAGDIAQVLQKARPAAAEGIAKIGTEEAQLGLGESEFGQASSVQALQGILGKLGINVQGNFASQFDQIAQGLNALI